MKPIYYDINGEKIPFFGITDSTMDLKFNRVARIASRYNVWESDIYSEAFELRSIPTSKEYNLRVAFLITMQTGIRIGNEDSAEGFYSSYKEKGKEVFAHTYGLTTILPSHVSVEEGIVKFDFTGKKHVKNRFTLSSHLSDLTISIIQSNHAPVFGIDADELTRFVKSKTSIHLSTKDFRTFRANVFAYQFGKLHSKPETRKERRDAIKSTIEMVAQRLNNTPGVVKKSYVDPELLKFLFPEIK